MTRVYWVQERMARRYGPWTVIAEQAFDAGGAVKWDVWTEHDDVVVGKRPDLIDWCERIPAGPNLHRDRESAEREMARLARHHDGWPQKDAV